MTNLEIITSAAIGAGLYTEDQAIALIEKLGSLPLHTFGEWKRLGYSVKKGEKAKLKVVIWKKTSKQITAENEKGDEVEADTGRFRQKLSHFFTDDQVDRIPT